MEFAELKERVAKLKAEKNAVILAHYYTPFETQELADFVGDSLELSRLAAKTDADTIVFCGVDFMAESAKILSPEKTVLTPDPRANCPMANMLMPKELRRYKKEHPETIVVAYVNCSAEIKAEAYICCTSANAGKVVASLPKDKPVLFVPDRYLGTFTKNKVGREMEVWPGFCPTHQRFTIKAVQEMKAKHPEAELLVHPECPEEVSAAADFVGSTSAIIKRCAESPSEELIIGTEQGVLKAIREKAPGKKVYPLLEGNVCPNMKLMTPHKVLWALEDNEYEIKVKEETRIKAKIALDRMLAL
jgi:quinolinate synthase